MCTFQGFGLLKHHQNSTKGPQESERRKKIVAGTRAKKARNFGLSGGGWSGGWVHRKWGARFLVSGSVQVFGDENRNSTETK